MGVIAALVPPEDVSRRLLGLSRGTEPLEQQHLTLLYTGSAEETGGERGRRRFLAALYDFALHAGWRGLTGTPNGWGAFHNPEQGEDCLLALWDIPGIARFRTELVSYVDRYGVHRIPESHGFTPHQTMSYQNTPVRQLPEPVLGIDPVHFVEIVLCWEDEPWVHIPLSDPQGMPPLE